MGHKGVMLITVLVIASVLTWMSTAVFGTDHVAARTQAAVTLAQTATADVPAATPTVPPEQQRFQRIGGIGGASFSVAVAGTLAFVGEGYRLTVYDVSNAAQPTKVSTLLLPATPRTLQVVGDHLIVFSTTGLQVISFQDPVHLVEIGKLDISDAVSLYRFAQDVYTVGSTAYVLLTSDAGSKLQVVNLTDITHPTLGQSIDVNGDGTLVGVGNTLYVLGLNSVDIVDISDAANPILKGNVFTEMSISDVAAVGTTLLIAGSDKLLIADVSNVQQPMLIGAYSNQAVGYTIVQVVGSTAYALHPVTYSTQTETLDILDVSTPTAPVLQHSVELPGDTYALAVNETNVYVVGSAGLTIVGSVNATPPAILGRVIGSGVVHKVATDSTQTYILSGRTLSIYPANDPTAPALLGQYIAPYDLATIAVVDRIAYLAAGGSGGLLTVDVHDGRAPVPLGRYLTVGTATTVSVANKLAYIVDGFAGLTIVDVSNPAQPTLRGRFTGNGDYYEITLNGSVAYITTSDGQLNVLDIHNPAQPSLITTVPDINVRSLYQVVDGMLYTLILTPSSNRELGIIDVRQPDAPTLLTSIATIQSISDVAVVSGRAFLLEYSDIEVLDVQQPQRPIRLRQDQLIDSDNYGESQQILLAGDTIYVANGSNGVVLLHFDASIPLPSTVFLPIVVQSAPTSDSNDFALSINVSDTAPVVGTALQTSGSFTYANKVPVVGTSVSITFAFSDVSGPWCVATTNSDGVWQCEGRVSGAMRNQEVTLTAQVVLDIQTPPSEKIYKDSTTFVAQ